MNKPDKITIKVLPSHYDALRRLAEADQEHASVIVRRLIKQEAERRGVWPGEAIRCK